MAEDDLSFLHSRRLEIEQLDRLSGSGKRKTDQFAAGAACQNHLSQLGRFGPGLLGSLPNLRAIPRPIEWTALGHRHTPGGVQRGISVHGGTGLWLSEPGAQELPLMLLRQSLQTAPRFLQQFPHGCHQGSFQLWSALLILPLREVGADIRLKLCPKVIHVRSPSHICKESKFTARLTKCSAARKPELTRQCSGSRKRH